MAVTTQSLPLLPLPGGVVVPAMVVNLGLETSEAWAAVAAAQSGDGRVVLVPQGPQGFARIGTVASVEQVNDTSVGGRAVLVRGIARVRVGAGQVGADGALRVQTELVADAGADDPRTATLAREYRAVLAEVLEHRRAGRFADVVAGISDPGALADTAVYSPELDFANKVTVLETVDVAERLELVLSWARAQLAELELRERVRTDATERMEASQREYMLRAQLAAIREELGDSDDVAADYWRRIAESGMPEAALAAANKEVDRLERMGESNPEHGWVRTWLDTLLELPWDHKTTDRLDLDAARAVLDADHAGLTEPKDRIVEFLAVRKLRAERGVETTSGRGGGAILALVGPPGVGKTSLGESVARALGRRFVRVALGGVRDEAEIRGHRRTYVGAQPGRIARALREAGTANPVFALDEVDKVAADWRGDPSAALLEVLDPAQNHTFRDNYLEVDLDLSDVLFIATANTLDTIPGPLRDRMEVITLDGYSDAEKATIARAHLLPRQMAAAGLRPGELELDDDALADVIAGWTREAGVRGLERQLGTLARKAATRLAANPQGVSPAVRRDDLPGLLGRRRVHYETAQRTSTPGVATGLAVTGAGGDVLFVEAGTAPGEQGLTLTGQLGEVMRESAQIALSYVRGHADALGLPEGVLDGRRVHVHVPAGAVPKDGPSAGVTLVTALASLLSGRAVRADVGMTGEVTLAGKVLPIGGVKQKVLAAHRAGLRQVILPARNADDLDDVPSAVRDDLTIQLVEDVDAVLAAALEAPVTAGSVPVAA